MKRGSANGEVQKKDVEKFAESHGLLSKINDINDAVPSLPNDRNKRGRENPRMPAVRKAFYVDLFEQEKLLPDYYREYCQGSEGYERSENREFYYDSRDRYEKRLTELSVEQKRAYKALKLKYTSPPPQLLSPKPPTVPVENGTLPQQVESVAAPENHKSDAGAQHTEPKNQTTDQDTLNEDIQRVIEDPKIGETQKVALILARIGQGDFRKRVLEQWEKCCSVTGAKTQAAIRASHIKPWRDCDPTNGERLDANNGLPLVASLDALFDKGLISFESSGEMMVSSKLNANEQQIFGTVGASLTRKPTEKMVGYLAYHRDNCFQK